MKKEMLVNVSQPEECRIAILEDGQLEELYTERASQNNWVGNIYRGRIVNLEPSIQAAFVDFGVGRNGFLHISDVEAQYFRQAGYDPAEIATGNMPDVDDGSDDDQRKKGRQQRGGRPRFKPPIQEIFRRGDEVLVQVIKEGIGSKGPTLSTYISIPGRYLVLMPALGRVGVSRKIEDEDLRRQLRDIMLDLQAPQGTRLHRSHGRPGSHSERTGPRPRLPCAAMASHRSPRQGRDRTDGHLRRKRHDHSHDPRYLHRPISMRS
jgi:ribonuclease E